MAKSLAIWIDGKTDTKKEIELHFNYWLFQSDVTGQKTTYLDVGVRFTALEQSDSIKLFFPFKVRENTYSPQLGEKIANSVDLISLIFNEEVEAIKYPEGPAHSNSDIKFRASEPDKRGVRFFTNIQLDSVNDNSPENIHLTQDETGSLLNVPLSRFNLPKEKDDLDGYFRFRLKLNQEAMACLSVIYEPEDRFMLTKTEEIELIDFRVNEIRDLPKHIGNLIDPKACFKKVHLFIIRSSAVEFQMAGSAYSRVRLIEGNLWKDYLNIENTNIITQMPRLLIFHWKASSDKKFSSFSVFAKFRLSKTSWEIISRNIFWLIIIGLFTNGLYDGVYEGISKFYYWILKICMQ